MIFWVNAFPLVVPAVPNVPPPSLGCNSNGSQGRLLFQLDPTFPFLRLCCRTITRNSFVLVCLYMKLWKPRFGMQGPSLALGSS